MEKFLKHSSKKIKFTVSLISAIIFHIGISTLLALADLRYYFESYFSHYEIFYDITFLTIMPHLIIFFLNAFSPLSGFIVKKIESRKSILISSVIIEITLFCLYFQKKIFVFYLLILLLGIGIGLSYGIVLKNVCLYYPNRKGFIGSILLFVESLGSFLSYLIGEKIINPDDLKGKDYYEKVVNRTNKYFIFVMIVIPVTTAICILLFYPYDTNCENADLENIRLNINKSNTNNDDEKNTNTKKIICNFRFWKNIVIICVMPFWVVILANRYENLIPFIYSLTLYDYQYYFNYILKFSYLYVLIWGFCVDKYRYKNIIKIICFICILSEELFLLFFFTKKIFQPFIYIILGIISNFFQKRIMMCVIYQHIMQIYEMRNFLIIGGFSKLFIELFYFVVEIIYNFVRIESDDEFKLSYFILAIVGIVLFGIGFIFTFSESDENFFNKNQFNVVDNYMVSIDSENNDINKLLKINDSIETNND